MYVDCCIFFAPLPAGCTINKYKGVCVTNFHILVQWNPWYFKLTCICIHKCRSCIAQHEGSGSYQHVFVHVFWFCHDLFYFCVGAVKNSYIHTESPVHVNTGILRVQTSQHHPCQCHGSMNRQVIIDSECARYTSACLSQGLISTIFAISMEKLN